MIKGLEILFSNLEVKISGLAYKVHSINERGEKSVFKFCSYDLFKKDTGGKYRTAPLYNFTITYNI